MDGVRSLRMETVWISCCLEDVSFFILSRPGPQKSTESIIEKQWAQIVADRLGTVCRGEPERWSIPSVGDMIGVTATWSVYDALIEFLLNMIELMTTRQTSVRCLSQSLARLLRTTADDGVQEK